MIIPIPIVKPHMMTMSMPSRGERPLPEGGKQQSDYVLHEYFYICFEAIKKNSVKRDTQPLGCDFTKKCSWGWYLKRPFSRKKIEEGI